MGRNTLSNSFRLHLVEGPGVFAAQIHHRVHHPWSDLPVIGSPAKQSRVKLLGRLAIRSPQLDPTKSSRRIAGIFLHSRFSHSFLLKPKRAEPEETTRVCTTSKSRMNEELNDRRFLPICQKRKTPPPAS